jgi:predicted amidophosphoribosyltransferase
MDCPNCGTNAPVAYTDRAAQCHRCGAYWAHGDGAVSRADELLKRAVFVLKEAAFGEDHGDSAREVYRAVCDYLDADNDRCPTCEEGLGVMGRHCPDCGRDLRS